MCHNDTTDVKWNACNNNHVMEFNTKNNNNNNNCSNNKYKYENIGNISNNNAQMLESNMLNNHGIAIHNQR